jgi:REP element-mobilizing transposase RayT
VNATSHWEYYVDDVDRMTWIRLLIRLRDRHDWHVLAFCQLTTHVHVLLDVANDSLPLGMEYLNREYSKDFNARHGRHGHLVRKRYGSRRIKGRRDLLGAYAYVVLNPVRAGACTRPEDWRWSSYATTAGLTSDFPFVDAALVLAEVGGRVDELRKLVDARAADIVRSGHVR